MSLATARRRDKSSAYLFTTMIWKCRMVHAGLGSRLCCGVGSIAGSGSIWIGSVMDDILRDTSTDGVCQLAPNRPDAPNGPGRSRWLSERRT
jgi:hypothetical protein